MATVVDSWWWDLIPAALGAVLGATAAAVPAFLLAKRASRETLERDREGRSENQKALAYRMMVKLKELIATASNVSRTIDEMIAEADAMGHGDRMLFQKLRPIAGLPDTAPRFDAEELALFVPSHVDVINSLMLAVARQSALLAQIRMHQKLDHAFKERYAPIEASGIHATVAPEGQDAVRFQLEAAALQDFVSDIPELAREDLRFAVELGNHFGPIMREILADPSFPLIGTRDEARDSGRSETAPEMG